MALTKIDDRGLKTPIDLLDNEKIRLGTGNDFEIYFNGTNTSLYTNTGDITIQTAGDDIELLANDDIKLLVAGGAETSVNCIGHGAVELYHNNLKKLETSSDGITVTGSNNARFGDNGKLKLGAGDDLEIYHDGSHSRMVNGTGELFINSSLTKINNAANNAAIAHFTQGGAVDLYHNGSKKFETSSSGALVTGSLGIGNTSPQEQLHIGAADNSNHEAIIILNNGGATGNEAGIEFRYESGTTPRAKIHIDSSNHALIFSNNNVERMRIDASGNIKIGESNSGDVAFSLVGDGNGILISRGASGVPTAGQVLGEIGFNGYSSSQTMSSADVLIRGEAAADHSGSAAATNLLFFTKPSTTGPGSSPTQRMKLDSEGRLGIGASANSNFKFDVNGAARIGNTTDGIIIENSTSAAAVNNACRIHRHGATGNLHITAGTSTARNMIFATKTNGGEIARLTSDGLCFNGDTAAANALDDYEEGTWTPTVTQGTVGVGHNSYTKIGRMVYVTTYINSFSNRTSTDVIEVTNLPFAPATDSNVGAAVFYRVAHTDDGDVAARTTGGKIAFLSSSQGGSESWFHLQYDDLNHVYSQIKFSMWYSIS